MVESKKKKLGRFFVAASFILSLVTVGMVFGIARNVTPPKEEVSIFEYRLGNVDESGKVIDSKKAIVTKTTHNVDGLTIDIDEESATITYRVVFYGEDGEYLSMTESMETDYEATSAPDGAETFRVVVTPNQVDGEDVTFNPLGIAKYATQLEVKYNK